MTEITRAVIYAAKSSEDRHGSIPTQLEDCRTMADKEGWTVIAEFSDEAFSAYSGNRGPGLAQARLTRLRARTVRAGLPTLRSLSEGRR